MRRRAVLQSAVALTGSLSMAGCLDSIVGSNAESGGNVTLARPDDIPSDYTPQYLSWNEMLPDVAITAPLEERAIELRALDKPTVLTFFFSHCKTVCPVLVSALREIQTHAENNGYSDEIELTPITFDPERDSAARLREYADEMNVDVGANNWHFLRPTSVEQATEVIQEQFGVTFEKQPRENGDGYMYNHRPLIVLANAEGYVERAYRGSKPQTEQILSDLKTVRSQ